VIWDVCITVRPGKGLVLALELYNEHSDRVPAKVRFVTLACAHARFVWYPDVQMYGNMSVEGGIVGEHPFTNLILLDDRRPFTESKKIPRPFLAQAKRGELDMKEQDGLTASLIKCGPRCPTQAVRVHVLSYGFAGRMDRLRVNGVDCNIRSRTISRPETTRQAKQKPNPISNICLQCSFGLSVFV